jgi:hypothetical protein
VIERVENAPRNGQEGPARHPGGSYILTVIAWTRSVRILSTAAAAWIVAATRVACGGTTARSTAFDAAADRTSESAAVDVAVDAGQIADDGASVPPVPPFTCDAGYFVEIDDDAGLRWLISSGCSDAGPSVPTLGPLPSGEDCPNFGVTACGGGAVLTLATGCGPCTPRGCPVHASYIAEDGGQIQGNGSIRFAGFPEAGAILAATFSGYLALEAGAALVSGRLCVHY